MHSKKTDNVPSRFLPIHQWSHGNSWTWAHDNHTSCAQLYIYIYMLHEMDD